jgi:hypothetical protein
MVTGVSVRWTCEGQGIAVEQLQPSISGTGHWWNKFLKA